MIGYLEGKLLKKEDERVLLLVTGVGYEILLPAYVMAALTEKEVGDELALYIYYQQTERQPKPALIGFQLEAEKEFFQQFISVEAIGPLKAVKAMTIPVRDIARAIESKDVATLRRLKGIGERTARKIVATLEGKVSKFAMIRKADLPAATIPNAESIARQVLEVLAGQLGYRNNEARTMITQAFERNDNIRTPEDLLDEVFKGEKMGKI